MSYVRIKRTYEFETVVDRSSYFNMTDEEIVAYESNEENHDVFAEADTDDFKMTSNVITFETD